MFGGGQRETATSLCMRPSVFLGFSLSLCLSCVLFVSFIGVSLRLWPSRVRVHGVGTCVASRNQLEHRKEGAKTTKQNTHTHTHTCVICLEDTFGVRTGGCSPLIRPLSPANRNSDSSCSRVDGEPAASFILSLWIHSSTPNQTFLASFDPPLFPFHKTIGPLSGWTRSISQHRSEAQLFWRDSQREFQQRPWFHSHGCRFPSTARCRPIASPARKRSLGLGRGGCPSPGILACASGGLRTIPCTPQEGCGEG